MLNKNNLRAKNKLILYIILKIFIFIFFLFCWKKFQKDSKSQYEFKYLKSKYKQIFLFNIREVFNEKGYVNINEVESKIPGGRSWKKNKNKSSEINVGSSLDSGFILRTMITTASVMDSQKLDTKLRLHFAVVNNFSVKNMMKIYSLRNKVREDVEFNFYNAKRVEKELKGLSPKGAGICARLLLPQLVDDDIKRLIIIDNGDVIVLRDLSEMYNWNMGKNIYMGVPDQGIGKIGIYSNKSLNVYINGGNYLIDVKKVKLINMYEKFIKYKNIYNPIFAEQDMLSDLAYGHVGYLLIRFGLISPYYNDTQSDNPPFKTFFQAIKLKKIDKNYSYIPHNFNEYNLQAFNPVIAHHWNAKWMDGNGMSIYRRLVQYYILLAGISEETCKKFPGYCKK
jgi:lipopolysaccharide biosynthesis glycosyltransferase